MATITTGLWQIPVVQYQAPEIDASGATDVGQDEVQTTFDDAAVKGYFGYSPADENS